MRPPETAASGRPAPAVGPPGRPNLILAGVTKAGTTSLVQYLGQHPDISIIPGKGVDHFTPLRYGPATLPPIEDYFSAFGGFATPWILDGSITYFTGGSRLIGALHDALPHARILVILRDPVARFWSAYRMKRGHGTVPDDVPDVRAFAIRCRHLWEAGVIDRPEHATYRTWWTGMYVDHLAHWWEAYGDAVHVMFLEDLVAHPAATMRSLFSWLDVDVEHADSLAYTVRNRSVDHRLPALRRLAGRAFKSHWEFFVRHQRLTQILGGTYRLVNARRFQEDFPDDVRAMVADAYRPATAALAATMVARGLAPGPPWLRDAARPHDDPPRPA